MIRTLAKLAGSLLLFLALLEIGLRAHDRWASGGTLADLEQRSRPELGSTARLGDLLFVSENPRLVYRLRPDLDVIFHGARLRTNSDGWRTTPVTREKPPGTVRILGLGDSLMFGWGVGEGETYLDLLEEQLETESKTSWQAINLAVPGYNLVQELELLLRVGLDFEPDLIVYHFVSNDVCLPVFLVERQSIWSLQSFVLEYLKRGAIRRELVERGAAIGAPAGLLAGGGSTEPDIRERLGPQFFDTFCRPEGAPEPFRALTGVESFRKALEALANAGESRGIPVVLLSTAPLSEFGLEEPPESVETITFGSDFSDHLREHGFASYLESDLAVSPRDAHPSAVGHRLIAWRLAAELERRGLLEKALNRDREAALDRSRDRG